MSTQTQAVLAHDSDESSSEELVPSTISDTTDDGLEPDTGKASEISGLKKVAITVQLSGVTFTSSLINGLVIIGLPAITKDLQLPPLWPFGRHQSLAWLQLLACYWPGRLLMS